LGCFVQNAVSCVWFKFIGHTVRLPVYFQSFCLHNRSAVVFDDC